MAYQLKLSDVADNSQPYQLKLEDVTNSAANAPTQTDNKPATNSFIDALPFGLRQLFNIAPSLTQSASEALPLRAAALGRGFTDIGEGLKQVELGAGEKMGVLPQGTEDAYTRQAQAERNFYQTTPSGMDPLSRLIRSGAANSPVVLPLGSLGLDTTLLKRLLTGAGTGGALSALSFVPEGESRGVQTALGAATGAAIPAIAEIPNVVAGATQLGKNLLSIPFDALKNLTPYEQEAQKATQSLMQSQAAKEQVEQAAEEQYGKKTPGALLYAKNKAQNKLDKLNQLTNTPNVNPIDLENAKNEYNAAQTQYLTAKARAKGDIGVAEPYAIQDRLDKAKVELAQLQELLNQNPPVHPDEINNANQALLAAQQNYQNAKNEAESLFGTSSPNRIDYHLNNNRNKIDEINNTLQSLPKIEPVDTDLTQRNLDNAQIAHEEAKSLLDATNQNMSNYFNPKAAHDVRAARLIDQDQEAIKNSIGRGFDELEDEFAKHDVKVNNADKIKQLNDDVLAMVQKNQLHTPEMKQLLDEIENLKQQNSTNAVDYLRAYRSMSRYAREARKKAYTPNLDAEERQKWQQTYDDLDQKVDEMGKALENGVGTENFARLKELNNAWRTKVVPLYNNTIYQRLSKYHQMPDDIVKSLRGDKEPGNLLIKDIIKKNPEILKNVVGQRYKVNNPEQILEPDENMQEYTALMPELNQFKTQRANAQEAVRQAKAALDQSKIAHDNAVSKSKQASDIAKAQSEQESKKQALEQKSNLLQDFKQRITQATEQKRAAETTQKQILQKAKDSQIIADKIQSFNKNIPLMQQHIDAINENQIQKELAQQKFETLQKQKEKADKIKAKIETNKTELENIVNNADQHIQALQNAISQNKLDLEHLIKANENLKKAKKIKRSAQKKLLILGGLLISKNLISSTVKLLSNNEGEE